MILRKFTKYFGEIPVFYSGKMTEIYRNNIFERALKSYCFLFHGFSVKEDNGKIPAILRGKSRSLLGKYTRNG